MNLECLVPFEVSQSPSYEKDLAMKVNAGPYGTKKAWRRQYWPLSYIHSSTFSGDIPSNVVENDNRCVS